MTWRPPCRVVGPAQMGRPVTHPWRRVVTGPAARAWRPEWAPCSPSGPGSNVLLWRGAGRPLAGGPGWANRLYPDHEHRDVVVRMRASPVVQQCVGEGGRIQRPGGQHRVPHRGEGVVDRGAAALDQAV